MTIEEIFGSESIDMFSVIPLKSCRLRRPDMIEKRGVNPDEIKSVILFLMPYYVKDGDGNISRYARPKDYHFYFDGLKKRLEPMMEDTFGGRFLGFSDESPIEETNAVLRAGLGIRGDSYVILNEKYGSFVFIGELLTTLTAEQLGTTCTESEIRYCEHCGKCRKACPMTAEGMMCLSAVTQKKGTLDEKEQQYIRKYGSVWGCDICQNVCPHNRNIPETPISFFREDRIRNLTTELLSSMDEETFMKRAFSWRKRETVQRNLDLLKL